MRIGSRPVLAAPGEPSSAAREVSGRKVLLGGLIALALNAACVLSVLGDQIDLVTEITAIVLLASSIIGVLAVALRNRLSGAFWAAARRRDHLPAPLRSIPTSVAGCSI